MGVCFVEAVPLLFCSVKWTPNEKSHHFGGSQTNLPTPNSTPSGHWSVAQAQQWGTWGEPSHPSQPQAHSRTELSKPCLVDGQAILVGDVFCGLTYGLAIMWLLLALSNGNSHETNFANLQGSSATIG